MSSFSMICSCLCGDLTKEGGVPDAPVVMRILRADIESAPTATESFGPGGVNVEGDGKALRKMQHSCIF